MSLMNLNLTNPNSGLSALLTGRILLFILLAVAGIVRADDTNAPPKAHWESVASADLTLTRGNSQSFLATLSLNTTRKWTNNEVLLGAGAGYGDTTSRNTTGANTTTKTEDFLKGFGQYNHLFTERFYVGLRLDGLHDDIADIQYRFTISPLAGYYFLKHTNMFLSGEVGPSYVYERLDDHTKSYAGFRAGERFEYKFKNGSRIWQTVEWIPQVDEFDNWIMNAEAGISAPITKAMDVRLVAQDSYDNRPSPGRLKNDLKLMAGLGYRF